MRNSKVRTTLHWILSCVNVTLSRCSPARADGRALYEDTLLILKILLCGALVVSNRRGYPTLAVDCKCPGAGRRRHLPPDPVGLAAARSVSL